MLRAATERDIPRLFDIRNNVKENRLADPTRVSVADVHWFISNPGIFVWEEDGNIVGFSAADPRNGNIWALFLDATFEGRGIGQKLFARACTVLEDANCPRKWLTTAPGTRAEAFYRKAAWRVTGSDHGELVFEASP